MIARRDLLIASACALAAGAAYALKPRKYLSLSGAEKVDDILPRTFGQWSSRDVSNLVAPKQEGDLTARLYGEVVERIYRHQPSGAEIMMLVAHGDTQTNDLQLHRPEVCYPAFGFEIAQNAPMQLQLPAGLTLPGRRLVAELPGRRESIVYWARLGEFMPVNGAEQRLDRLKTAMAGYVADGLLARFSAVGPDSAAVMARLEQFVPELVMAVAAAKRSVFIGTGRAGALATARL